MTTISFERLLKLRLTVARFGEMDHARWWNTQGILGRYGALALGRGFPKTHQFARAGVAFSVAAERCREIYAPSNACTLWRLPPETEARFHEKWRDWLEKREQWADFFEGLEDITDKGLLDLLSERGLLTADQAEAVSKLRRSAEGRSVQIPTQKKLGDDALTLLAAAFVKGEPGKPAIPFMETENLFADADDQT